MARMKHERTNKARVVYREKVHAAIMQRTSQTKRPLNISIPIGPPSKNAIDRGIQTQRNNRMKVSLPRLKFLENTDDDQSG